MAIETDKDRIRLLISDVGGGDGASFIFNDDEVNAFLDMGGSVYKGAALALKTLAGNEALVMKHITFLELKTDGATVAKELRELAKTYEDQADNDSGDVTIIEMVTEPFGAREMDLRRFGL